MIDANLLPEINLSICDGCAACVRSCPNGVIVMQSGHPAFEKPEACTYCAACEEICPRHAVRCAFEIVWDDDEER